MPLRWIMLLVLFLVRLAMGYQFQSVASVSSHLVSDLGLSYTQVGTLIGFFLLPGIFIAIPSGTLTRAVTDKNLLMIGALTMVVGALVMATADGVNSLYGGRLITGIGGTIFNLVLTKMVTDWFAQHEIITGLADRYFPRSSDARRSCRRVWMALGDLCHRCPGIGGVNSDGDALPRSARARARA